MAVSEEQIAHALELFDGVGPMTTRKMFGGLAIYADGKVFAILMMVASLAWLALFTEVKPWITLLTAAVMLSGAIFILSKPSRPPLAAAQPGPDAARDDEQPLTGTER